MSWDVWILDFDSERLEAAILDTLIDSELKKSAIGTCWDDQTWNVLGESWNVATFEIGTVHSVS
jgi:hypothetical protein